LCRIYWYPLYAYVRRQRHSKEDAEDLTQAFFERFLQKNYLDGLSSEGGKFRAFLLASLKNFLANEWDKAQRQKRGGGAEHLSLDWESADQRYHLDPADPSTSEKLFDREWALALLETVISNLGEECATEGKTELFNHSKSFLMVGDNSVSYVEAAQTAGMEEGALRVAVHRLRKRYRQLLKDEIAQTLADPAGVEEELRSLQAALSS
jgi:RNA polymerase sigma factor (sigma-70 family)